MKEDQIFRSQALREREVNQYGAILLIGIGHPRAVALFFVIFIFGVVSFFTLLETTRKIDCQGILIPSQGVFSISSTQPGVISKILVIEGQSVKKNDVIFIIDKKHGNSLSSDISRSKTELLRVRERNLEEEIKYSLIQSDQRIRFLTKKSNDLKKEISQVNGQVMLQKRRTLLAYQNEARYQELAELKFVSSAQVQQHQASVIEEELRTAELQRVIENLERDLLNVQSDISDVQIQSKRNELVLKRDSSEVNQAIAENEAEREIFIRATRDGKITTVLVSQGQTVGSDVSIATLIPEHSPLEAEVYATSRAIGFINAGVTANLRYQAFPYQRFGVFNAVVTEVSNTSLRPDELRIPRAMVTTGNEPVYRIKLKIASDSIVAYGKEIPLKPGMVLDASFKLERRKLIDWVLDPIYTVTGRI